MRLLMNKKLEWGNSFSFTLQNLKNDNEATLRMEANKTSPCHYKEHLRRLPRESIECYVM